MTSRERVIAALEHREPDRVPLDLGASIVTGIHAQTLVWVRRALGLDDHAVRIYDIVQMLGEVEMDLVERLGLDVLRVDVGGARVGARSDAEKLWEPWPDVPVLIPADLDIEPDEHGGWLYYRTVGGERIAQMSMPAGSYYFDTIGYGQWHHDFVPPPLERIREISAAWHLHETTLEALARRAQELRASTDKALLMTSGGLGMCYVGHLTDFLCLLAEDPGYVHDLFQLATEVALANLHKLWGAVGDSVDLIWITGLDFGSQRCELFSPRTFREVYLPALRPQYEWIRNNTTWFSFEHSCGSIAKIVGDMAQAGLDALNPVQTTAAGMDPAWLKRTVGDRLTFWGGGVQTQDVLQFGTPDQVRAQVAERVRIFGPGGGFVFCADHNIQPDTPPENVVAAYDTARETGRYPIRP
ncbi:MAG: uroporphyrinogen decarboxylase family protein [Armatimonadota bacterium]